MLMPGFHLSLVQVSIAKYRNNRLSEIFKSNVIYFLYQLHETLAGIYLSLSLSVCDRVAGVMKMDNADCTHSDGQTLNSKIVHLSTSCL